MKHKQTRDLLIRNIPIETFHLLEALDKENNRSRTQEAIIALTTGLSIYSHRIKQPKPYKWQQKISDQFIHKAINEGRQ
ncbi:MAG TPA: hypothetical protein PKW79_08330 [Rhabdochlamydiaceae bacterium]|nr:hypothetical protein [Rhabdochlamydiaceae bacterium]